MSKAALKTETEHEERNERDLSKSDWLTGAHDIGRYLGWDDRKTRYAARHGLIPCSRLGTTFIARKSKLDKFLDSLPSAAEEA